PRAYDAQRGVSLSTRTYCSGSRVVSIEPCWTLYGWATKVWMPRKMTTVRTRVSTTSNRQPRAGRWVTRVGGSQDREYRGGSRAIAARPSGRELTPRNGPRYTPAALETGRNRRAA